MRGDMTLGRARPAAVGDDVLSGILLMVLAVMLFSVLNAGGKFLSADYSIVQIVWARFAGSLVFMLLLFAPKRGLRLFAARRPVMQIARALLGAASSALYFKGLSYIPLPTAAAISFTSPLLIAILSGPLLGERVGLHRWGAVLLGFAGALLVIRPGAEGTSWAALFIVGSTSCSTLYQIMTRKMAGQDEAETTAAWTTLVGTVLASFLIPFEWRTPDAALDWTLFLLLGVLAGAGHLFLTKAYERAPASTISPFNYAHLLGATAFGYVIFGDFPDAWTWAGAALIVACGLYIARVERRR